MTSEELRDLAKRVVACNLWQWLGEDDGSVPDDPATLERLLGLEDKDGLVRKPERPTEAEALVQSLEEAP